MLLEQTSKHAEGTTTAQVHLNFLTKMQITWTVSATGTAPVTRPAKTSATA